MYVWALPLMGTQCYCVLNQVTHSKHKHDRIISISIQHSLRYTSLSTEINTGKVRINLTRDWKSQGKPHALKFVPFDHKSDTPLSCIGAPNDSASAKNKKGQQKIKPTKYWGKKTCYHGDDTNFMRKIFTSTNCIYQYISGSSKQTLLRARCAYTY